MTVEPTARLRIDTDAAARPPSVAVRCAGAWTVRGIGGLEARLDALACPAGGRVVVDVSAVTALDTAGAWLLQRTLRAQQQRGAEVRVAGSRPGFDALLGLVAAHAGASGAPPVAPAGLLAAIGRRAWTGVHGLAGMLSFVGEVAVLFVRTLGQPRRLRWRPVLHNLQTAGFEALPIVGLLSFLMGVVIAYQGADQLQRFGANIFVVDLVGIAMLRELSPLLTAIIVAGRSGSAYTAQIGTMKINEEIDALRTIGVGPHELLVLPKILALVVALPLLTVYADAAGLLGGMVMARAQLDIGFSLFLDRLGSAIDLSTLLTGLGKAPVFAVIIALVGCYQGLRAAGSADSVGRQTTVSVVQAIFLVIVADALFSVAFNWFGL